MKFMLACSGTRGDCEPSVTVGYELQRRGHDVCIAIPPNLVGLAESVGLTAVAYGPEADALWDADFFRTFTKDLVRSLWTIRGPVKIVQELWEPVHKYWGEMSATLTAEAEGADLLCAGLFFQDIAANIAEHHEIPFVTLHYFPMRPNGQVVPILPPPLARSGMKLYDWFGWRLNRKAENTQRCKLGLPQATNPSPRRIAEQGALEIQAYDDVCFPGLAAEWAEWDGLRPLVGALTMELSTDVDDEVAAWISAGSPPICFGFGSMPIESPAGALEMIAAACAELGERALVCAGWSDFGDAPQFDHVKVVGQINYTTVFPACRAIVHHGGSGTTAASLRAGVPTLILWTAGDQPFWGARLKRAKVGTARSFTSTTPKSLTADLRRILAPEYRARAREFAAGMTQPAESIHRTADLIEKFAYSRSAG